MEGIMNKGSKNNLYVRDRMERNGIDYDGSGIGSGYYDSDKEKRERLSEAAFPLLLAGILLIFLGFAIYIHCSELMLKKTGYSIMADYSDYKKMASFKAPDGTIVKVNARWALLSKDAEEVPVYFYENEIYNAQVLMNVRLWIMVYGVLGSAFAGCIFWAYKELHKSKHAKGLVSSGKFDN